MASGSRSLPTLELNDIESRLRDLLLDVARYANPSKPSQLRFTGGWVRDKLLGSSSHDIDVAINDMTGYSFGLKMQEYLQIPGRIEKYAFNRSLADSQSAGSTKMEKVLHHGLHKIEANPEKSKHLETVTTKIFGLDIDLVNLRKETYSEDSRNPAMELGTPEEDALRRDATINAMFYNLQTNMVEDFTQMGLSDMERKIIRTPLEPYQTFKDDPLRVLRLIRFSSKLKYTLDSKAEEAAAETSIKEALKLKISRERVGIELEKMLKGPNPHLALSMIDRLGLYTTIFTDPTAKSAFVPDTAAWKVCYDCVMDLSSRTDSTLYDVSLKEEDNNYIAWLLSAFVPYFDAPIPTSGKKALKDSTIPAAAVAREGIKAPNKIIDIVKHSVNNAEAIISVKDRYLKGMRLKERPSNNDPCGRDTLGMAIRGWGLTWLNQIVFALCLEATRRPEKEVILKEYNAFIEGLKRLNLLTVCAEKPILNGGQLAAAMGMRTGPWMKEALDAVMAWQLRNPGVVDTESAIEAVKAKQGELPAILARHFLELTIRPLFAHAKTQNVTAQGRKTIQTEKLPKRYEDTEAGKAPTPWKAERNRYGLEILTWTIDCLNGRLAEENWPLLIPPILGLLDDGSPQYKIKGCNLLFRLLHSTSIELINRTGLGPVFEDAISPSLAYLPTLTPEDESIGILEAVYPALIQLKVVQYPSLEDEPVNLSYGQSRSRARALALILHDHILPSVQLVQDTHPAVVASLLRQLQLLIKAMAVDTITQLVYIIPQMSSFLESPFGSAHPAMLAEVARTLQYVLANAWPRAWFWRATIIQALGVCWIKITEDIEDLESEDQQRKSRPIRPNIDRSRVVEETEERTRELQVVKVELNRVARMLISAVEATSVEETQIDRSGFPGMEKQEYGFGIDIRSEIGQLVAVNDTLRGLFAEPPDSD